MQINGERISEIIPHFCKSKAEFARIMEVSPQTLNNWLSRDNGKDILIRIAKKFPTVSISWLINGKGEMFIEEQFKAINEFMIDKEEEELNKQDSLYTTFLLPTSAVGGALTGFAVDGITPSKCEQIVTPIKDVDFALTVYGDSMYPEYPSGSKIFVKKIDPQFYFEKNRVYVIDTPNGAVIKQVEDSDKEGYIKCVSLNPDPKYKPFEIKLDKENVFGIYRVLMCMSVKGY